MRRGIKENVKADNIVLEINSSRHAYAATPQEVVRSTTVSVLTIAATASEGDLAGAKLFKEIQETVSGLKEVLAKYCKTPSAQMDCLRAFEGFCGKEESRMMPIAKNVLHCLYEEDVVSEDAVFKWFKDNSGEDPDFGMSLRKKVKPFLEWLQEDSDDDESD